MLQDAGNRSLAISCRCSTAARFAPGEAGARADATVLDGGGERIRQERGLGTAYYLPPYLVLDGHAAFAECVWGGGNGGAGG